MALRNRSGVRRLIERSAWRALGSVGVEPPPPPAEDFAPELEPGPAPEAPAKQAPVPEDFLRELRPGQLAVERAIVSTRLFERLNQGDVEAVERALEQEPELHSHYVAAPPEWRQFLVLAYGMWFAVPSVVKKTGLIPEQPPEDVHAMARGPLAGAGGVYEADMVADALMSVGFELSRAKSGLDIGCSSGRVVRVLAAAYPKIKWQGCDPNEPAIEWAQANLPGIDFFVSGDAPPLPRRDRSLDLAYAISIWSHFEPQLGLRWFEEMHRLIRPGGQLVCTTHGLTSVDFYAARDLRTPEQSQEIRDALYRQGWWYAQEFGEEGDWGVVNPDWGTAFVTPEWMLTQLCPRWRVVEFAPGRNQDNQDVYVLERV